MAQSGNLCTDAEFAEYCPLFRRLCIAADVIAGPAEARAFARMQGKAFNWLVRVTKVKPSKEMWISFLRVEAQRVKNVLEYKYVGEKNHGS
jgi:hypothetical protein